MPQGVFAGEPNYGHVLFGRDGAMKLEEVSMSEFEQAMRDADSSS